MEQDNENRTGDPAQPVEHDLFAMNNNTAPAVPSVETKSGNPENPSVIPPPETEAFSSQEPLREPEFKVNSENRPPVRMLNSISASVSEEKPVSGKEKVLNSLHSGSDASLGSLLQEARTLANYTIFSASAETHIRSDYIEALENDKPDSLPNQVFLKAYVRALVQLYGLDVPSAKRIEEKLKDFELETEVPEKLIEDIGRGGQISEAEARRIKMMLIYGSIILLLLVSLVVTSVIGVSMRRRSTARRMEQQPRTEQKFDTARLENLLPPQLPKPQMLQIPSGNEQKKPR